MTVFADQSCLSRVREYLAGESVESKEPVAKAVRHREFTIPAGATCSGQMVRELSLPPNCILTSISRDAEVIVPHGDTVLQAGDVVEIFGSEDEFSQAELCLTR